MPDTATEPVAARKTLTCFPKQAAFAKAVLDDRYKYLAYGGAIRGGKTFANLIAFVLLCRRYPRSRWAIVRADLPRLRRTVLPAFEKIRRTCSNFVGPMNQATWTSTCANGSQIMLFEEQAQQDPELERWHGFEVNGFGLEEADELRHQTWIKSIERAGAWIIPDTDEQPLPKILVNFNPCAGWPREYFYTPYMLGTLEPPYFYQPATIEDNPYIPEAYKESLLEMPDDWYQRYVKGDWSLTDHPNQLISSKWIADASKVEYVPGPEREGVDVAWTGDDWNVFCRISGNMLRNIYGIHGTRDEDLARMPLLLTTRMSGQWHDPEDPDHPLLPCAADHVWWDAVGLGAGGYSQLYGDALRAGKRPLRKFVAGAKPIPRRIEQPKPLTDEEIARAIVTHASAWTAPQLAVVKFRSLKAQAYWECREKFRFRQLRLPYEFTDPRLIQDLTDFRYEIDGEQYIDIEDKNAFRKRTGRSPDWGEAFVMSVFDPPANRQFTSADYVSMRG